MTSRLRCGWRCCGRVAAQPHRLCPADGNRLAIGALPLRLQLPAAEACAIDGLGNGPREHLAPPRHDAGGFLARAMRRCAIDAVVGLVDPDAVVRRCVLCRHGDERQGATLVGLHVASLPEQLGQQRLRGRITLLAERRQVVQAAPHVIVAALSAQVQLGKLELRLLVAEEDGGMMQVVRRAPRIGGHADVLETAAHIAPQAQ